MWNYYTMKCTYYLLYIYSLNEYCTITRFPWLLYCVILQNILNVVPFSAFFNSSGDIPWPDIRSSQILKHLTYTNGCICKFCKPSKYYLKFSESMKALNCIFTKQILKWTRKLCIFSYSWYEYFWTDFDPFF